MIHKLTKKNNINTSNLANIEKWILNDKSCPDCTIAKIRDSILSIKIQKEPTINYNSISITSSLMS